MKNEHEQKINALARREEDAKKQVHFLFLFDHYLNRFLFKSQVTTWEQMYREWMATMETRVNSLQLTNEELQVRRHFSDFVHHLNRMICL